MKRVLVAKVVSLFCYIVLCVRLSYAIITPMKSVLVALVALLLLSS